MKISRKYPIFLLLTTLGTSAAIFFALRGVLQTSIEKELTSRGSTSARSFAMSNGPLLLAEKTTDLRYNLISLGENDPSIVNAMVADVSGKVIASLDKQQIGQQMPA